jgi:DNA repair ATPase RecN
MDKQDLKEIENITLSRLKNNHLEEYKTIKAEQEKIKNINKILEKAYKHYSLLCDELWKIEDKKEFTNRIKEFISMIKKFEKNKVYFLDNPIYSKVILVNEKKPISTLQTYN